MFGIDDLLIGVIAAVVVDIIANIAKALAVKNPDENVDELGDRVIQAEEAGIHPEDFEKHDADNYQLKLIWYKYAEENLSCEDSQDWLSQNFTFTTDHLLDIEESQWCKLIKKNKYHFVELNGISSEILMTIVEQNAYVLNKRNVEILVSYLLDINCESTSYQLVCGTENVKLIERIEAELGTCLKTVFSAPEKNKETEDAIIGILYSTNATEAEKISYLSNQQKQIDLGDIESAEATKLALKCDVVKPTWENVIYYMNNISEKIADDQIVQFINRHASTLSSVAVPTESRDNELMLLRQLIKTNLLPYETFCKVLKRFTRWRFNQNVPILEERRVSLMIEYGIGYIAVSFASVALTLAIVNMQIIRQIISKLFLNFI